MKREKGNELNCSAKIMIRKKNVQKFIKCTEMDRLATPPSYYYFYRKGEILMCKNNNNDVQNESQSLQLYRNLDS